MADSKGVKTTGAALHALGGIHPVARLTGADWKNVEGWYRAETFPARYFLAMWLELVVRGYSASPALWKQTLPRAMESLLLRLARDVRRNAVGLAQVETLKTYSQLRGPTTQSRIRRKA